MRLFPIVRPLLVPRDHIPDALGIVTVFGNHGEARLEQFRGVGLEEGLGGQGRHEHLAVDAVGMECDFCVEPPVSGRLGRIAGKDVAPELPLHLASHELAHLVLS